MRIPGSKHLALSGRWLRSRWVHGAMILGYHRIATYCSDPYSICVTPENFSEHLAIIRENVRPITLQHLVGALRTGTVPPRSVVITLDDGYADNLHIAKPLLERYEVPATFFITSGYLGREFWWDQLDRILPGPATLPEHLSLTIRGGVHRLEATGPGNRNSEQSAAAWRQRSLFWLYGLFQPLLDNERQKVMEQIRAWPGALAAYDDPAPRLLSPDELRKLAQDTLVEIGAHSISHPHLVSLAVSEQTAEIQGCKNDLENIINRPVTSFAYPHGSLSGATATAVRNAGYSCACTSLNDIVWSRSDCFELPRFWPTDCDGASFGRWLRRWMDD